MHSLINISMLYYVFLLVDVHQLVNISYWSPTSEKAESVKVDFGTTVNVSCIANFSSKVKMVNVYPLWLDDDGDDDGIPLTKDNGGVVAIFKKEEHNNSASRILQLRPSVINGTKWPKPFKCAARVRLSDGDELIHHGKKYSVEFVGELRIASLLADICVRLL